MRGVIARLVRSADFERVLRTRSRLSSPHFALHHLPDRPSKASRPSASPVAGELSTGADQAVAGPVDDFPDQAPEALWLGAVVPKRHAKRSVTRTLLKRQIRAVVGQHADGLANGLWVVRLRAPFDRSHFVSAASDELRRAAHQELDRLIASASRRPAGA